MRLFKPFIHVMLVLAILSAGLPLHHPADMNRDGELGLTDAIVSVRQLVRSATGDGPFRDGLENTLTTLSVAAGLKTVIRTGRDPGGEPSLSGLTGFLPALSPEFEALPPADSCAAERPFRYISPVVVPITPPPRGLA